MKQILIAIALVGLLFAAAAQAQTPAPKPGPEHQQLGAWIGAWELEYEVKLGSGEKG